MNIKAVNKFKALLFVFASISLVSCSENETIISNDEEIVPFFINPPMRTDTLRVLAVGNSFTEDATSYLDKIVYASNVDRKRICLYQLVVGSTSLSYWEKKYSSKDTVSISRRAGSIAMEKTKSTFSDIVNQNWDVIVFQQLSKYSNSFSTFSDNIRSLISKIHEDCPNKNVSFAWQSTWSYWNGYEASGPHGEKGWNEIVLTADELVEKIGIDIIIPSGTAIQNARSTSLNTPHAITRDGYHMAYGIGRYIVACTWFETLFAPVFDISVLDNSSRISISDSVKEESKYEAVSVTDDNVRLCQECAIAAVKDRHSLMTENISNGE